MNYWLEEHLLKENIMSRRRNRLSNEDLSSDEDQSSLTSESSDDESDQQRDLTNDEMEKLIQLQDLTGM